MPARAKRQPAATGPATTTGNAPVTGGPDDAKKSSLPPLTAQDWPAITIPAPTGPHPPQSATVRPLTFADVAELAARGGQVGIYLVEQHAGDPDPVLVPATLTVDADPAAGTTGTSQRPVYRRTEDGKEVTTEPPLGMSLGVAVKTVFGSETSGRLQTTQDAENRIAGDSMTSMLALRRRLAVPDPDGAPMRLVPVYGSMVNLTGFVKGIDDQEVLRVVQEALEAAFPAEALLTLRRFQARPVADQRVNVLTAFDEPIAVDVLAAEASYVAGRGAFRTVPIPSGVARGVR